MIPRPLILTLVLALCWSESARCETSTAADLLPATTAVLFETAPAQAFASLPLTREIVANELFLQVWRTPGAMKLRGGMTLVELALGEKLPVALSQIAARGVTVAIDSKSKGIALLARACDAKTCSELTGKLIQIAQSDAQRKGQAERIKSVAYRGIDAYEIQKAIVIVLGDWLLISNNSQLGKEIVDHYLEPTKGQNLSSVAAFVSARKDGSVQLTSDGRLVWGWADVGALRSAGLKKLVKRPRDNFVAELLLGGLLAAAGDASTATLTLDCPENELRLRLMTPQLSIIKDSEYQYFFGADGKGAAPPILPLDDTILALSAYRDIAELWRRAGDLFGERTNAQLAQADATLTTLFSGRDFGEEILGAIEPAVQLIVASQKFDAAQAPVPAVQLPALALVTRLREPSEMQRQLKRIFTSLVGFINVTGAMNHQPQLDIDSIQEDGVTFICATYAVDVDRPKDWQVPIQFNFSPTLAMTGKHAVLASTSAIARSTVARLRAAVDQPPAAASDADGATNTLLLVNGARAADALAANRAQLVSQNMIEKGHTHEEAADEIGILLRLLNLVESLQVRLQISEGAELTTVLRLNLGQ